MTKNDFLCLLKEEVKGKDLFLGDKADLSLQIIREKSAVADGCAILQINNNYVLHLSPKEYPDEAVKAGDRAREIKTRLGAAGGPVLVPLADGRFLGRSYTISQRCTPLRSANALGMLDRIKAGRTLFPWLRGLASSSEVASPAFIDKCKDNATLLATCSKLSEPLKAAIATYHERISGFSMRTIPMHGDLWLGNVMRLGGQIVVIDWGGGLLEGYPVFDLIRLAISLKLPMRKLRSEIAAHAESVGSAISDLDIYLISCFAHIYANLHEFPELKFVEMVDRTWKKFKDATG